MSDISTLAEGLGLTEEQVVQLTANLKNLQSKKLLELDSDIARVKEGARITQAGLNLIAKGNTGATVEFTRVVLGDALDGNEIKTPTDEEVLSMTNVIHAKKSIPKMADAQFTGGGTFTIKFPLNNADYTEGFWCREIGLFAKDPDTKKEILYCYKNNGALSTYVPAGDGAIVMNLIVSLITIVDQTTDVKVTVSADFQFVTAADLQNHITDKNPHPNLPIVKSELVSSTYFWATGDDRQLHPVSKSNLQTEILGGSVNSIPALNSRVGQNEINIANLYMQLKAQAETGLDANLLLIEDFANCECIDMLNKKVNVNFDGGNYITVDSFDGLKIGHLYTLTDGKRSQTVRITSFGVNETSKAVFLNKNVNTRLSESKTTLRRTTGLVEGNQIIGSSTERVKLYAFGGEWRGLVSGEEKILTVLIEEGSEHCRVNSEAANGRFADYTDDGLFTLKTEE